MQRKPGATLWWKGEPNPKALRFVVAAIALVSGYPSVALTAQSDAPPARTGPSTDHPVAVAEIPPPPAPPAPTRVHLTLRSPVTGAMILHRPVPESRLKSGEPILRGPRDLEVLCQAPCEAEVTRGLHELGVAVPGREPIVGKPAFLLSGPSTLELDVKSRASTRAAGWWLIGATFVAGATSTTLGLLQTCDDDSACLRWASLGIWTGIGVMSLGALIGLPWVATEDEATVRLVAADVALLSPEPLTPPEGFAGWQTARDHGSFVPRGLAIQAQFR